VTSSFVPPDEDHQFANTSIEHVLFVCSILKVTMTAYYLDRNDSDI